MTATLSYKYFVKKGKNHRTYPEWQRAGKIRVVFRNLDNFKNIFVQITLTNTALWLSSSNKTFAGKGLSQITASLKARLDCSEPYLGDFASSLVVVTPTVPEQSAQIFDHSSYEILLLYISL